MLLIDSQKMQLFNSNDGKGADNFKFDDMKHPNHGMKTQMWFELCDQSEILFLATYTSTHDQLGTSCENYLTNEWNWHKESWQWVECVQFKAVAITNLERLHNLLSGQCFQAVTSQRLRLPNSITATANRLQRSKEPIMYLNNYHFTR